MLTNLVNGWKPLAVGIEVSADPGGMIQLTRMPGVPTIRTARGDGV